jgi:DNA-binding LacI/PurR family transcriptional regulator
VDYLVGQGHRRIAIAAWPDESLAGKFRLLGYLSGLEAAGIGPRPEWIFRAEHSEISGREALAYWWTLPAELRPTAVVAVSDLMAIGVMNEAERLGLRVGHDLSVIGFDDAPMSQYLRPSLSTLRQPIPEIAERVIQILEALLLERSGQPAAAAVERQVLLPPELIIRDSSGPAPQR